MTTGCSLCDEAQKRFGDSRMLCVNCEIEYHDSRASYHMQKVEELKNRRNQNVPKR